MSPRLKSRATQLRQAADLIHLDQRGEARALLEEILAAEPANLTAWEYLAQASSSREEEIYCLKRILALDPEHRWARRKLEQRTLGDFPDGSQGTSGKDPFIATVKQEDSRPGPVGFPAPAGDAPSPSTKNKKRTVLYLVAVLILLCIGGWGALLLWIGSPPPDISSQSTLTAGAQSHTNCRELIDRAMLEAGDYCDQVGPNKVCYGNITLQAELIPDSQVSFSQRGDIIDIFNLLHLTAAPLNPERGEWGVAIFKLLANLPRSLPGEMVTLVVFGNTSLDNPSQNLQTFYFSSQLGQVSCEKIPLDGILISMPEGVGISLEINGAQVTLAGTASLHASPNESMEVNLYSGSGSIASNGGEQYFGAGETVSVALGGPNGNEAVSPPSAPQMLTGDEIEYGCQLTGAGCDPGLPATSDPGEIKTELAILYAPSSTWTPTASLTPSSTPIRFRSRTPSATRTPSHTPTSSDTPTSSHTPNTTLAAPLSPFVDCVLDDGSGTYQAFFGYDSLNTGPVVVPVGSDNLIFPAPEDRGQPTDFLTGNHPGAFSVPFVSGSIEWTLTGTTAVADLAAIRCPGSVTATAVPPSPCAALSIGTLYTPNSTDLAGLISNTGTDTVTIDTLEIYWINSPTSQNLQAVSLAGAELWSGVDNVPTSLLPTELPWTGGPGARQIGGGSNATLLADFQTNLVMDASHPRYVITFTNGCVLDRVYP